MTRTVALSAAALLVLAGAAVYFYRESHRELPAELSPFAYPGARLLDLVRVGTTVNALLETADSPVSVSQFYKERLGGKVRALQTTDGAILQVQTAGGRTTITVTPDAASKRTRITLTR